MTDIKLEGNTVKMDGEEYYVPTRQGYAISHVISSLWDQLGKPDTPFSESGEKLMDLIIATWEDTFPKQHKQWIEERKLMHSSELSNREKIKKHTGRNLAAYPYYVYKMIKLVFPNFNFMERENQLKLVKKWPVFRMVEKA
jgi:hypothetical protein